MYAAATQPLGKIMASNSRKSNVSTVTIKIYSGKSFYSAASDYTTDLATLVFF